MVILIIRLSKQCKIKCLDKLNIIIIALYNFSFWSASQKGKPRKGRNVVRERESDLGVSVCPNTYPYLICITPDRSNRLPNSWSPLCHLSYYEISCLTGNHRNEFVFRSGPMKGEISWFAKLKCNKMYTSNVGRSNSNTANMPHLNIA